MEANLQHLLTTAHSNLVNKYKLIYFIILGGLAACGGGGGGLSISEFLCACVQDFLQKEKDSSYVFSLISDVLNLLLLLLPIFEHFSASAKTSATSILYDFLPHQSDGCKF